MTKIEAIKLMKEGKKLTHRYFSPNEWVTIENNSILFEDGCECSQQLFWYDRKNEYWNDDWSLFE